MAVSMHGPKQYNLYRNRPELSRYTYRNMLHTKDGAKPFHFRKDECSYKRIMHFHWQFYIDDAKEGAIASFGVKMTDLFFIQIGSCSNVIVLYNVFNIRNDEYIQPCMLH